MKTVKMGHEFRDAVASGSWGQPSGYSQQEQGTSVVQVQGTGSACLSRSRFSELPEGNAPCRFLDFHLLRPIPELGPQELYVKLNIRVILSH